MIQSKEDYLFYLESDRLSSEIKEKYPPLLGMETWKFQRLLRKIEYYKNCKKGVFWKIYLFFLKWKFHKLFVTTAHIILSPMYAVPGYRCIFF